MQSTERMGPLRCHIYDQLPEGKTPQLAVITCHGFGAPGTDLVSIAPEILVLQPQLAESTRFYFPEAPISLAEAGMPGGTRVVDARH